MLDLLKRFLYIIKRQELKDHINTLSDLLEDADFRAWVLEDDPAHLNIFWSQWQKEHPEKQDLVIEAKAILEQLKHDTQPIAPIRKDAILARINETIATESKPESAKPQAKRRRFPPRIYLKIAAVLALFLASISFWKVNEKIDSPNPVPPVADWVIRKNAKGQKSKLYLPDGSTVILNADSELRYDRNGFGKDQRALILSGEAFFEVEKDPYCPFTVQTGSLSTTALGTSFNINAYPNSPMTVFLATGSVLVAKENEGQENDSVQLVPGQVAYLSKKERLTSKKEKNLKQYEWTRGTLFFDKTPFDKVIIELERWYGVQIKVLDKGKSSPVINGEFKQESLKNVLETMKYSLDFTFSIDDHEIVIKFNNSP